jgi:hypothetical protein
MRKTYFGRTTANLENELFSFEIFELRDGAITSAHTHRCIRRLKVGGAQDARRAAVLADDDAFVR